MTVRLQGVAPPSPESAPVLVRAVQAAALPADQLEHMYAQVSGAEVDMVMYFVATSLANAERAAAQLIRRAQRAGLAGWRTLACQVELIVAIAEAALPPDG